MFETLDTVLDKLAELESLVKDESSDLWTSYDELISAGVQPVELDQMGEEGCLLDITARDIGNVLRDTKRRIETFEAGRRIGS